MINPGTGDLFEQKPLYDLFTLEKLRKDCLGLYTAGLESLSVNPTENAFLMNY